MIVRCNRLFVQSQVLMEIRRLVVESEAAHPASNGAAGGITFSGASEGDTPRLLKRPSAMKRPGG